MHNFGNYQAQLLSKEITMKCFAIKVFAWIFLQLPIKNIWLQLDTLRL